MDSWKIYMCMRAERVLSCLQRPQRMHTPPLTPRPLARWTKTVLGRLLPLTTSTWLKFPKGLCCSADETSSLSSSMNVTRMTAEEKQYLQLLAMSQLGGVIRDNQVETCRPPAVLVNQSGSTETMGRNWLLPVAARDSYDHFFDTSLNVHSYQISSPSKLPSRIRL